MYIGAYDVQFMCEMQYKKVTNSVNLTLGRIVWHIVLVYHMNPSARHNRENYELSGCSKNLLVLHSIGHSFIQTPCHSLGLLTLVSNLKFCLFSLFIFHFYSFCHMVRLLI